MNALALRNLFRSQLYDAVEPFLWSDPEVYGYMDRAQRKFCTAVRGIADARTPEITEVAVVAGEMFSPLDPRVLQVRSAYNATTGSDLAPFSPREVGEAALRQTGDVTGYSFDDEDGAIRWTVVPAADAVVNLVVYRLPRDTISSKSDELEIPPEHQEALLDWMAHLAYLKHDAEAYDKRASDEAGARFLAYCRDAREQLSRKRHTPRAVRYGGY